MLRIFEQNTFRIVRRALYMLCVCMCTRIIFFYSKSPTSRVFPTTTHRLALTPLNHVYRYPGVYHFSFSTHSDDIYIYYVHAPHPKPHNVDMYIDYRDT